ncbi:DNA polymerase III subunit gamma/tau [Pasteurellaceae bacterium RH1A]|nr:DNA polymerase III subunit gamma/tau [Pasteurellaceae bacterium RH1A]
MSYQVLARKWRPQRFSQVVGQGHVLSALENGLREGRLHHAYLFSGTRGVGKTSIARLFAKGLNCENGITADPCGECANCKAIEEGRFIDLIEIDAASRTKVEDTRELLDNVQYKPTVGRFKVYLIDEVHMLSRHSFNALLKTLEEPPEYVKFLLATTDPQKLPITILSRCMQFHLRALEAGQIRSHLEFILQEEQIPFELPALEKLAKAANGSVRDALSLTDQAIAVSNANITLPTVQQMLGLIDDHQPLELVQALALADGEKAMAVLQSVAEKGVDWQQLLSDVAQTLHQIALLQLLPHSHEEETPLHFLAKQIAPEDVQFFYQLMLTGKKELPLAPDQRSGVEMTFLRALAFHPKRVIEMPLAPPSPVQPPAPSQPVANPQDNIAAIRERLGATQAQPEPQQAGQNAAKFAKKPPEATALAEQKNTATSPALEALKARQQLQAQREELAQKAEEGEKKKPEPLNPISSKAPSKKADKLNLQERFAALAAPAEEKPAASHRPAPPPSDEEYRWTWLNPELEHEVEEEKPSDIKQAILQERTPELVRKTIALSCERDEWSRLISQLNLGGLPRQLALNSYVSQKSDKHLNLVLNPSMAHLNNDDTRQSLAQALEKQGFDYQLRVGEANADKTPLELRRQIFEELTQQARTALHADPKLALLKKAFGAELDESTIRAVAEK